MSFLVGVRQCNCSTSSLASSVITIQDWKLDSHLKNSAIEEPLSIP